MIPDWFAVLILFIGVAIGWISRMRYETEARKDEQVVDDALNRAWQAGWRSARDE
jgi:hypothetical protein